MTGLSELPADGLQGALAGSREADVWVRQHHHVYGRRLQECAIGLHQAVAQRQRIPFVTT